ncbi:hypothetical protein BLA18112_07031 [Burkholderia lata]|uniref:Uncharacterized protein n=1 Tax=Burkholderia lata (strain ATCC 17760 / DSM 23089 / LMG 22485 / NCIMB 9086 / R18194 / 383) TaxID=482957 RepID=A0A6P3ALD7_BURL3|nr:hypothetical protein BLA18112_07031 [Burkholderia lata]
MADVARELAQRYPNFKTVLWRMLRNIPRADEYRCL